MNAIIAALLALQLFSASPAPASCTGQPIPADGTLLGQSSQGAWYFLIETDEKVGIIRWTEESGSDYELINVRVAPNEKSPVTFLRVNFSDRTTMLVVVVRCSEKLMYQMSMIPNIDIRPKPVLMA